MTTSRLSARRGTRLIAVIAAASAGLAVLTACGTDHSASAAPAAPTATHSSMDMSNQDGVRTASMSALYTAMRAAWGQHMEWTYAAIASYAVGSPSFDATADRLLQNQVDIGDAIKPYYGDQAGDALTGLLKTHITDVVAILKAAKAGDKPALDQAEAATYGNAQDIADFLAKANSHWPQAQMRQMMKTHIDQTNVYATDQLQGKYADSINTYGTAEAHMAQMADMLSAGIIAAFPNKFTS